MKNQDLSENEAAEVWTFLRTKTEYECFSSLHIDERRYKLGSKTFACYWSLRADINGPPEAIREL